MALVETSVQLMKKFIYAEPINICFVNSWYLPTVKILDKVLEKIWKEFLLSAKKFLPTAKFFLKWFKVNVPSTLQDSMARLDKFGDESRG